MTSPLEQLTPVLQSAIVAAFGDEFRDSDPVLRPSQFADLQSNAPLALAKRLGLAPRQVAERIVAAADLTGVCSEVQISGPGFINLTMSDQWVSERASEIAADPRLGIPTPAAQRIVVDYSSPNAAKEMHVGHLRTTVVGDALVRTLEILGHDVIRQNHLGDWGTAFGMLIEHLLDVGVESDQAQLLVTDPNAFYQGARVKFDGDPSFEERSRNRVVLLQGGDADTLGFWQQILDRTKAYLRSVYAQLGVTLTDADIAGESSYNDELAGVCEELEAKGIATISDGALCIFLPGFTGREGKPTPLIIRKTDGGYGYATTDLATIRRRALTLHADRSVYVVGAAQSLHFQMVWQAARLAGWLPEGVVATHVQIGSVLGSDKKMLRTRSGDALRMQVLLDEAVAKARAVIDSARPDLGEDQRSVIATQVGIGAVKYADLSVAHDSDYVFDLDRMVALTGNTGPYLQYVTARVRSIFRQVGMAPEEQHGRIDATEPAERALALHLLNFGRIVEASGDEYEPHRLAGYLFELAQLFSGFYENCPVLKAEVDSVRQSRLTLSALTFAVMTTGLGLLGIEAPEQM